MHDSPCAHLPIARIRLFVVLYHHHTDVAVADGLYIPTKMGWGRRQVATIAYDYCELIDFRTGTFVFGSYLKFDLVESFTNSV